MRVRCVAVAVAAVAVAAVAVAVRREAVRPVVRRDSVLFSRRTTPMKKLSKKITTVIFRFISIRNMILRIMRL